LPAYPSSGYRTLMVNAKGEFTASQIPTTLSSICNTPWCTNGNDGTAPGSSTVSATDFLGTTDEKDFVLKTNNFERMRIMSGGYVGVGTVPNIIPSTRNSSKNVDPAPKYKLDVLGNMRVLVGTGSTTENIVFRTDYSTISGYIAQIGIGTETPTRALHIVTRHLNSPGTPTSCSTCLEGPHNGLRLEDQYKANNGVEPTKYSIWDIAPMYNKTANTGMLVLGLGSNDPYYLEGKMVLLGNGNVGVGTANPKQKLQVNGSISIYNEDGNGNSNGNTSLFFGAESVPSHTYGKWGVQYVTPGTLGFQGGLNFWVPSVTGNINAGNGKLFLADNGDVEIGPDFKIQSNGNVGIGTIPDAAFKLEVCGAIRTQKVVVELLGCDFVFESEYKLKTLEERKEFIFNNRHLPNIASASQMQKNVDLGIFAEGLLQNLEEHELYLYQFSEKSDKQKLKLDEMEKLINGQQISIQKQNSIIEELKKEIEILKNKE